MRISEFAALDAVGLATLVRTGELHAPEVTEAAIEAVQALNPSLNALVLEDFEGARAQALRVRPEQALAGVPFLVKDIGVFVAGWPTTNSSRFYADAAPRS
ncbi:MAG: amidase, partial [Gammaproteobacteria bacterium]|nr:amidase [Gammaproteobacteria bacterium]